MINLTASVQFPVPNVRSRESPQRSARPQRASHGILKASIDNAVKMILSVRRSRLSSTRRYLRLFPQLRGSGFTSCDKACSNPHSASTHHQSGSEASSVEYTTRCNESHIFSFQGRCILLTNICTCGDKHAGWNFACMTTSLAPLGTNYIGTSLTGFMSMLIVMVSELIRSRFQTLERVDKLTFGWPTMF